MKHTSLCIIMVGLLGVTIISVAGCRLHPMSLAVSLVGETIDDRDVQERKPLLLGKNATTADEMFGERHDTLVDNTTSDKWLIYREAGERFSESFYVVETSREDRITGLFKCKRNTDGLEDVHRTKKLGKIVYGKTPSECEAETKLGEAVFTMHSELTGAEARFYNVRDWVLRTPGDHYCVLIFSKRNLCEEIRIIGVTAQ